MEKKIFMKINMRYAYELKKGESFEPLEFIPTSNMNMRFIYGIKDYNHIYHTMKAIVHPALLYNMSNNTRSPSFKLPKGYAEIHTHEETEFINPAYVDRKLKITWEIIDIYKKKDKTFFTVKILITDTNNRSIMKRKMTYIFVGNIPVETMGSRV